MMGKHTPDTPRYTPPANDRRPVTAHDVARLAGVSQSAVSRTFTEGASVSDDTRNKVMAAANRLGYRPNFVARSLITGRSNIIGVTVPGLSNPFYAAILDALSAAFAHTGYRVMLFSTEQEHSSDPVLEEILRYRVDALVLVASSLSSHFAEQCQQIGLPVVLLNRKTNRSTVASVTGENRLGAQRVGEFLLAGGHRRFAYIAGLESSSTSFDREQGFTEYLTTRGHELPMRAVGNYTPQGARAAMKELLSVSAGRRPDAVFCANDQMALAAITVARFEFGLHVGRDISIVGFDDTAPAAWPEFALTTYSQPVQALVERTVHLIRQALARKEMPHAENVIEGRLIVRDSARLPEHGIYIENGQRVWSCP